MTWEVDLIRDVGEPDDPTDKNGYMDMRWTNAIATAKALIEAHALDPSANVGIGCVVHRVDPDPHNFQRGDGPAERARRRSVRIDFVGARQVNAARLAYMPPPYGRWLIEDQDNHTNCHPDTLFIDGLPF